MLLLAFLEYKTNRFLLGAADLLVLAALAPCMTGQEFLFLESCLALLAGLMSLLLILLLQARKREAYHKSASRCYSFLPSPAYTKAL